MSRCAFGPSLVGAPSCSRSSDQLRRALPTLGRGRAFTVRAGPTRGTLPTAYLGLTCGGFWILRHSLPPRPCNSIDCMCSMAGWRLSRRLHTANRRCSSARDPACISQAGATLSERHTFWAGKGRAFSCSALQCQPSMYPMQDCASGCRQKSNRFASAVHHIAYGIVCCARDDIDTSTKGHFAQRILNRPSTPKPALHTLGNLALKLAYRLRSIASDSCMPSSTIFLTASSAAGTGERV
jgi:hypothetical protein